MMYRDAWFTPDIQGEITGDDMLSPQDQLAEAFTNLEAMMGAWNGRLWIQVMDVDTWTSDYSLNQSIYENLIQSCDQMQQTCGVYSSY